MNWSQYQHLINWGSLPDWFAAVGSVGSVLFVYVGLRRELRSRRADELRVRAAQARLVSAVPERRGSAVLRVLISNESDAPVLDVAAVPRLLRDGRVVPEQPGATRDVRLIHGRETEELFVTLDSDLELEPSDALLVELTFTDHDGNRWRRLGPGQPEPVG